MWCGTQPFRKKKSSQGQCPSFLSEDRHYRSSGQSNAKPNFTNNKVPLFYLHHIFSINRYNSRSSNRPLFSTGQKRNTAVFSSVRRRILPPYRPVAPPRLPTANFRVPGPPSRPCLVWCVWNCHHHGSCFPARVYLRGLYLCHARRRKNCRVDVLAPLARDLDASDPKVGRIMKSRLGDDLALWEG